MFVKPKVFFPGLQPLEKIKFENHYVDITTQSDSTTVITSNLKTAIEQHFKSTHTQRYQLRSKSMSSAIGN